MFTKTTLTAIRTLVYVGLHSSEGTLSLRSIAAELGESPTYLVKVARQLVKAGILRAHRGVSGGVELGRPAERIALVAIVEACQGAILPDFCQETPRLKGTCALHRAGTELHEAILGVLSRWTLADFVREPSPTGAVARAAVLPCLLLPRPRTTTR